LARAATGRYYGSSGVEIVEPSASYEVILKELACGSCRTCGKRKKRVSHEVLGRRKDRAAHRPHEALLLGSPSRKGGSKMSPTWKEATGDEERRFAPMSDHLGRNR